MDINRINSICLPNGRIIPRYKKDACDGKCTCLLRGYRCYQQQRAFKTAKDAQKRRAAENKIPFEEEMEEIFGEHPIISTAATVSIGGTPRERGEPESALPKL